MSERLKKLKEKMPNLKKRELFLRLIRDFFHKKGFLEVDAPLLVKSPSIEPHLDPFEVIGSLTKRRFYLPTSPEFYLKKVLSVGEEKVFSLSPSFRDEVESKGHSLEFLMLEWYRANSTLETIRKDVEELLVKIGKDFPFKNIVNSKGKEVALDKGVYFIKLNSIFKEKFGKGLNEIENLKEWREMVISNGGYCEEGWDENDCFSYLFITKIEEELKQFDKPVILFGFPLFQSALSEIMDGFAERFELFICGIEIANAYNELVGKEKNLKRYKEFQKKRETLSKKKMPIDEDFLDAVENLPPSSGIALGVDRLLSLLLNCDIDMCQNR